MEIKHCVRCNRDWRFGGEGRPRCCGKCKSPYWDVTRRKSSGVPKDIAALKTAGLVKAGSEAQVRDRPIKTVVRAGEKAQEQASHFDGPMYEPEPFEQCKHTEFDSEIGETFGCTLPAGHRGKCQRGSALG